MKIACLFAASALASVAPPRISLSLSGFTPTSATDVDDTTNFPTTVAGMDSNVGKTCQAGIDTVKTCQFPIASAWDHQEQKVDVQEQIWHLDSSSTAPQELCNTRTTCVPNLINYEEPGEYLFLYNAEDTAGNKARQQAVTFGTTNARTTQASVTFNLIIRDEVKPQICYGQVYSSAQLANSNGGLACQHGGFKDAAASSREFVHQGGQSDFVLRKAIAHDDITYPDQMDITYTVRTCSVAEQSTATTTDCSGPPTTIVVQPTAHDAASVQFASVQAAINRYVNGADRQVGFVQVRMEAHDEAGIYGANSINNQALPVYIAVDVRDTIAPTITVDSLIANEQYECNADALAYYNAVVGNTATGANYVESMAKPPNGVCSYNSAGICVTTTNLNSSVLTVRGGLSAKAYLTPGTYQVVYKAEDVAGNKAHATRSIKIVDTGVPTITIDTPTQVSYQITNETVTVSRDNSNNVAFSSGNANDVSEAGVTVGDDCDQHLSHTTGTNVLPDSVSYVWDTPYNTRQVGSYVKTYTVTDHAGLTAQAARTYYVVDQEAPRITIEGDTIETFHATRDKEYKDDGATCADFVDGQLNHRVRVGGDIVDLSIVGTYTVEYTCEDLTGNPAVQMQRTVIVQDITAPTIHMNGQETVRIEAGFPYTDAGATASDTLEGPYTNCGEITASNQVKVFGCSKIQNNGTWVFSPAECETSTCQLNPTTGVVSPSGCDRKPVLVTDTNTNCMNTRGNTVNEYKAYRSMTSCAAIYASSSNGANSGPYQITVEEKVQAGNTEHIRFQTVDVQCDMDDAQNIPTYYVATNSLTCDSLEGFTVLEHKTITARQQSFISDLSIAAREYLLDGKICVADVTVVDNPLLLNGNGYDCNLDDGVHACTVGRIGNYEVTYSVTDHAGNEASKIRTVIVEDTLPPVISLHFKTKQQDGTRSTKAYLIQQSAGGVSRQTGSDNPAANKLYNPYLNTRNHAHFKGPLMAESTTSVNGWLIAAGVSAVAGMALLASSSQKTVTSVPV